MQIDDIFVPQIEEEIAEVRNRSVSGMSLYATGHLIQICVDRVTCLSEHNSMRMHACFQLLFVVLTFLSTDDPH